VTVKAGEEWGRQVTTAVADAVVVEGDAALAAAIPGIVGTRAVVARGGDLHRSLGAPTGAATRRLPIDAIAVAADEHSFVAVAHVVARRRGRLGWWRGPIVAVMNVDHVGNWDVAPRAHPNDGWLDVVAIDGAMSRRARWQVLRRLPTGTHLPHPDIATRRVREATYSFDPPLGLTVDGVDRGTVRSLRVSVEPDAAEIYV
jgi:hypothetical protein